MQKKFSYAWTANSDDFEVADSSFLLIMDLWPILESSGWFL